MIGVIVMFNMFFIMPCAICLYDVLSMICPLRFSLWAKIPMALILACGLTRIFLLRMTPAGFDVYELPRFAGLILSSLFSLMVCALFMLLVKDVIFMLWKVIIRQPFPSHYASLFVLVLAVSSTVWGVYQGTRVPDVVEHEVRIKGLAPEFEGMKAAMLVDIHVGSVNRREFVQAVVDKVNALEPDVILIPGDFVDGQVRNRSGDLEPLSQLHAPHGVLAVTGNHEYYYDLSGWLKQIESFGIKWLENEHVLLERGGAHLAIAGVPDPTGGNRDTPKALDGIPGDAPVILMDHQPRFAMENSKLGVSLQLSGHTHGGQMPGISQLVARANGGFVRGWYDLDGMKLYNSPGTSQWDGFIIRLFDPSEITLLILHGE